MCKLWHDAWHQMLALSSLAVPLWVAGEEHPDCPCINPWGSLGRPPSNVSHFEGTKDCLSYTTAPGEKPYCYPLDYGIGRCAAWDEGMPPFCVEARSGGAHNFCSAQWCWVDKDNCVLSPDLTSYFKHDNMYYSYETCGFLNFFTERKLKRALVGRTLRVGLPGEEPPYLNIYEDRTVGGISPIFLRLLGQRYGFELDFKPAYNDSREQYPQSSYTACVRDVALKRFDMCAGIFYVTPQRSALADFSPVFFSELFSLVVFREKTSDSAIFEFSKVRNVFRPFTPALWAALIVSSLLVGLFLFASGEFSDKNPAVAYVMSTQLSLLKALNQTSWGRLKTVGSGVVAFGFGFVCMVSVSSYTAVSAAFYVTEVPSAKIQDLKDAISIRAKICALEPLKGTLLGKYPAATDLFVWTDWFDESLERMEAGECQGMLMNENEYARMLSGQGYYGESSGGRYAHCNKIRAGDVLLSIPVAMPLHKDLSHTLSYMVTSETTRGEFDRIMNEYNTYESRCDQHAQELGPRPLSTTDLSGAFLLTFVSILLGAIVHFVQPFLEQHCCGENSKLIRYIKEHQEADGTYSVRRSHSCLDDVVPAHLRDIPSATQHLEEHIETLVSKASHLQDHLLGIQKHLLKKSVSNSAAQESSKADTSASSSAAQQSSRNLQIVHI